MLDVWSDWRSLQRILFSISLSPLDACIRTTQPLGRSSRWTPAKAICVSHSPSAFLCLIMRTIIWSVFKEMDKRISRGFASRFPDSPCRVSSRFVHRRRRRRRSSPSVPPLQPRPSRRGRRRETKTKQFFDYSSCSRETRPLIREPIFSLLLVSRDILALASLSPSAA